MPTRNARVKCETRVAKVREGRLKASEPTGRGSPQHVGNVPLVSSLCVGQSRSGAYTLGTGGL